MFLARKGEAIWEEFDRRNCLKDYFRDVASSLSRSRATQKEIPVSFRPRNPQLYYASLTPTEYSPRGFPSFLSLAETFIFVRNSTRPRVRSRRGGCSIFVLSPVYIYMYTGERKILHRAVRRLSSEFTAPVR